MLSGGRGMSNSSFLEDEIMMRMMGRKSNKHMFWLNSHNSIKTQTLILLDW